MPFAYIRFEKQKTNKRWTTERQSEINSIGFDFNWHFIYLPFKSNSNIKNRRFMQRNEISEKLIDIFIETNRNDKHTHTHIHTHTPTDRPTVTHICDSKMVELRIRNCLKLRKFEIFVCSIATTSPLMRMRVGSSNQGAESRSRNYCFWNANANFYLNMTQCNIACWLCWLFVRSIHKYGG